MRNFLAFFKRFRVVLYFALLQGVALALYFTYVAFPRSQYMTTASSINGSILSVRNDFTKHFNLEKNNQDLQEENIHLRDSIPSSFIKMGNRVVKINDTLHETQYEYISAVVINSTHTKQNNYFTLNIGSEQGIKRGDGVFSDNGIVGRVHNTSKHYAVVKSCLTSDINTAVLIKESGEFGILKWKGEDPRKGMVYGVSNDSKIKIGSHVVTRGGAGIFPRGLPVGKVTAIAPIEGQPLWDITILYSENYRTLQNVYIVKNLLVEEQEEIEKTIPIN